MLACGEIGLQLFDGEHQLPPRHFGLDSFGEFLSLVGLDIGEAYAKNFDIDDGDRSRIAINGNLRAKPECAKHRLFFGRPLKRDSTAAGERIAVQGIRLRLVQDDPPDGRVDHAGQSKFVSCARLRGAKDNGAMRESYLLCDPVRC